MGHIFLVWGLTPKVNSGCKRQVPKCPERAQTTAYLTNFCSNYRVKENIQDRVDIFQCFICTHRIDNSKKKIFTSVSCLLSWHFSWEKKVQKINKIRVVSPGTNSIRAAYNKFADKKMVTKTIDVMCVCVRFFYWFSAYFC